MNILFVTPRLLYPPNRGDRLRPFHFARVLSKRHNLYLLSFIQSKDEISNIEHLNRYFDSIETVYLPVSRSIVNVAINLFSFLPLQVCYFKDRTFKKKIDYIINDKKIQLIYIFHLRLAQYFANMKNVYRVLDLCDAVTLFLSRFIKHAPWYKKPIYTYELRCVRKYEKTLMQKFNEYWIISDEDKRALETDLVLDNLYKLPNGIDVDYFQSDLATIRKRKYKKNIFFVGYMNVESVDSVLYFYHQMFPFIKAEVPGTKFYVVGADPPKVIRDLSHDPNVIVTGYVEDLKEWYMNANVVIAPNRFVAGMQNKVLEAMAMCLPVVCTSFCNEGINATNGKEIFVANNPTDFAQMVVQLLKNRDLATEIGERARIFVQNNFRWERVEERIIAIEKKLQAKSA